MGAVPVSSVLNWFTGLPQSSFRITAINEAEIRYGIVRLPEGRKKRELAVLAEQFLFSVLEPLPFDRLAALAYAEIAARIEQAGCQIDVPDAQIAAIAKTAGAAVATRNVDDFEHCGVKLINPWSA